MLGCIEGLVPLEELPSSRAFGEKEKDKDEEEDGELGEATGQPVEEGIFLLVFGLVVFFWSSYLRQTQSAL